MCPLKKLAISQSNYIPWKGYFDLIAAVDEFILYDEMQFTKNDWRNRNKIKTKTGLEWLTIPVGKNIHRRICDVSLSNDRWQIKHWKALEANYKRAPYYSEVAHLLEPIYCAQSHTSLSAVNRKLLETICNYLQIKTKITNSWDYTLSEGKTERLVELCIQAGAKEYISGPSARNYINETFFRTHDIKLTWFDYIGYQKYPQLWSNEFDHNVSILDLLFNCGPDSANFMKHVRN